MLLVNGGTERSGEEFNLLFKAAKWTLKSQLNINSNCVAMTLTKSE